MEFYRKNQEQEIVEKTEPITVIVESDLASMVPVFLKNRMDDLQQISEFIKINNFEGLKKIGHDLRGVPGAFGYDFLVDIGFKIEMAARNQDLQSIIVLAERYERLMKVHEIVFEGDDTIYHCQDFL